MEQVGFYHLQKSTVLEALPPLVDKIHRLGLRCHIYHQDSNLLAELDKVLWTYTPMAFLPHGVEGEEDQERTPIWLSTQMTIGNEAVVFIALDAYNPADLPKGLLRVVDMFDGTKEDASNQARARWSYYGQHEIPRTYWQQDAQGKWTQVKS